MNGKYYIEYKNMHKRCLVNCHAAFSPWVQHWSLHIIDQLEEIQPRKVTLKPDSGRTIVFAVIIKCINAGLIVYFQTLRAAAIRSRQNVALPQRCSVISNMVSLGIYFQTPTRYIYILQGNQTNTRPLILASIYQFIPKCQVDIFAYIEAYFSTKRWKSFNGPLVVC